MFGTLSTKCGDFTIFLVARYGTCQWLNDLSACPHTFAVYPLAITHMSSVDWNCQRKDAEAQRNLKKT